MPRLARLVHHAHRLPSDRLWCRPPRQRARGAVAGLAAAAAVCGLAEDARAENTVWQGTASGDVAVTDNVFAEPTDADRDADFFFQLRPGVLFSYNGRRMVQQVDGEVEILHYGFHSRRPSLSFRDGWRGIWLTGPRSQLVTTVNASTGILSSLSSRLTPDETAINLQPVGKVTVQQADASESLTYDLSKKLRLTQGLFARLSETDDNLDETSPDPMAQATLTHSAEAGAMLGISRSFQKETVTIEAAAAVQRFERIAPMGASLGSRRDQQLAPRGRANWRHDVDRRISFTIDGGLVFVVPFGIDPYNPDDKREPGAFPVLGAQVALRDRWGHATMGLRRDVTPNMFIAQNTVTDEASVSAALPLPWGDNQRLRQPKLIGLGTVGVTRTHLIDSVSTDPISTIGAGRVDLGITYTPRPGIAYTVRYELMVQTGDEYAMTPIRGFFRNTVYFTFNVKYPEYQERRISKVRKAAVQVDGKPVASFASDPSMLDLLDGNDGGDDR
jgi:hypothetical protein